MIRYTEKSMLFTESGFYLVEVTNGTRTERTVAEYDRSMNSWQQIGIDYDVWTIDAAVFDIDVVCRLEIAEIAEKAREEQPRRIVAICEPATGFENTPIAFFTESLMNRIATSASLRFVEVIDTAPPKS